MDAAKHNIFGFVVFCRELGKLKRIAGRIGELNDLILLVVMARDEKAPSEPFFHRAGACFELASFHRFIPFRHLIQPFQLFKDVHGSPLHYRKLKLISSAGAEWVKHPSEM
ncbi:hypothetical protein LR69_00243 [Geobacillus sp. BCO2]|nr:hypothetical protein LR69_00243 [Geobacillus sp. BCO2]